ncbi:MAG: hypothetical protein OK439_02195 [Thaumarchaeota archaeon]|nr:hypothetical protein [Nitrososphaerota archaeon]
MSRPSKNRDISARRRRKQEKGLPWAYIVPALIVLVVIVLAIIIETRGPSTSSSSYLAPGKLNFALPCLPDQNLFMHIHPWIRIVVDGKNVTIPGAIGIENAVPSGVSTWGEVYGGSTNTCFEPLHTHDSSGIIHIESTTNTTYTLDDFFQIWAQSYAYSLVNGTQHPIVFNSTDILGFKTNSTDKVVLLVDGHPSTAFGSLVLNTLAYCSANDTAASSPCEPTATGAPSWNSGQSPYPYGTGHTIVIEYGPASTVG